MKDRKGPIRRRAAGRTSEVGKKYCCSAKGTRDALTSRENCKRSTQVCQQALCGCGGHGTTPVLCLARNWGLAVLRLLCAQPFQLSLLQLDAGCAGAACDRNRPQQREVATAWAICISRWDWFSGYTRKHRAELLSKER